MVGITLVGRVARDPRAAMAFAVEITEYIKERHHTASECWLRVGGPSGQIVWQTSFENMTAMENFNESLLSDEQYWTKVKEIEEKGLFDMASFEEGVWTKLG